MWRLLTSILLKNRLKSGIRKNKTSLRGVTHGSIANDYRHNAPCHCEERSDEAIHFLNFAQGLEMDCFTSFAMT